MKHFLTKIATPQILVGICLALVSLIIVSEAFNHTPNECNSSEFHPTYAFTLQDLSGPCTYLQRVTSSLEVYFLEPLALGWPLVLTMLIILMTSRIRHKGLRPADWELLRGCTSILLGLSLLACIFFTIVH